MKNSTTLYFTEELRRLMEEQQFISSILYRNGLSSMAFSWGGDKENTSEESPLFEREY